MNSTAICYSEHGLFSLVSLMSMMEDFIAILPPFLRPCSRLENKTVFTAFVLQQNIEKRLLELLHSAVLFHAVSSFFFFFHFFLSVKTLNSFRLSFLYKQNKHLSTTSSDQTPTLTLISHVAPQILSFSRNDITSDVTDI